MAGARDRAVVAVAPRSVATRLVGWFRLEGRDLPWRRTRDPYAVLVSEIMLQQTQVTRVERAWPAFLDRFPDVGALAAAPTADVLQQWRGLGYNRRALNLQLTSRVVVADHDGVVPDTMPDLVALPGVGPYTARAVLAFAYERPVAAVDVNVARVLHRLAGERLAPRARQELGDAIVTTAAVVTTAPPGASGDPPAPGEAALAAWTAAQALMELGARVCTPRRPDCGRCPLAADCAWRAAGMPEPDPAAAARTTPAAFVGSDRYHRGRLLDALRDGPVRERGLATAACTDDVARARQVADALVSDGLAEWTPGTLQLPEQSSDGARSPRAVGCAPEATVQPGRRGGEQEGRP